jgi:ABC-type transport system involved in cytochrome c biogenesis ATPase subunit
LRGARNAAFACEDDLTIPRPNEASDFVADEASGGVLGPRLFLGSGGRDSLDLREERERRRRRAHDATSLIDDCGSSDSKALARVDTSSVVTPRSKLRTVEVFGLFSSRDVRIELAVPGPTLLTGANGTGKSSLLRIIYFTLGGYWFDLQSLPFVETRLHFDNDSTVTARKDEDGLVIGLDDRHWRLDLSKLDLIDIDEIAYRGHVPLRAVGPGRYEFEGRRYNRRDLQRLLTLRQAVEGSGEEWLVNWASRYPVIFITDQRLIVQRDERARRVLSAREAGVAIRPHLVVMEYARDLAGVIGEGLSEYAEASQNLDRLFPRRVVDAMAAGEGVDTEYLRSQLQAVEKQRLALEAVGLLRRDASESFVEESSLEDARISPVIQVYAEDTLAKFDVLRDLQRRLEVFVVFLNQHYQDKKIEISPLRGFVFRLEDGSVLQPGKLSSGEQQILVLAYQVLFKAERGTLILIDEPELSLHVLWQSSLVDDLAEMAEASDLNLILATHSPTLIGDREALRRSLDES